MYRAGFFLLQMKRDLTQTSVSKYLAHMVEKFRAGLRDGKGLKSCHQLFSSHICACTLFSLYLLASPTHTPAASFSWLLASFSPVPDEPGGG